MADPDGPASETRAVWLGVVSLCLVQFVDVLGVTVMVTALPAMLSDLHASADAASLISTGYAMFFGGLLMFGARLGGPVWSPAGHLHRPGDLYRGCCRGCDGSVGSGADGSQVLARCGCGPVGAV